MQYKINFSIDDGETTIIDNVTFTFDDGVTFERNVPQFPILELSEKDKIERIIKLGYSEKIKYDNTPKDYIAPIDENIIYK